MIFGELYNWAVTNNKSTLVPADCTREDATTSEERSLGRSLASGTIQPVLRQSTSAIKRKTPVIGAGERIAIKCPELTIIDFIRTHILDSSACRVTTWKDGFTTFIDLEIDILAWVSTFRRRRSTTLAPALSTLQRPILWFVSKTTSAQFRKIATAASASEYNAGIGVNTFIRILAATRHFLVARRREG
jgi:hypothetical protein